MGKRADRKLRVKKYVEKWTAIVERNLKKEFTEESLRNQFSVFCVSENINSPQDNVLRMQILSMSEDKTYNNKEIGLIDEKAENLLQTLKELFLEAQNKEGENK